MSVFMEVLEWVDPSGREMIYRIPQEGSADIKMGAQLIVRDSQMAIFFHNGHAADSFSTGRHTLSTYNLPIITRLLALPFGFKSPFRAEVYYVNMKVFTDLAPGDFPRQQAGPDPVTWSWRVHHANREPDLVSQQHCGPSGAICD
jgi:membrane protease subunit (stomatin/prohibitin family)